jgi:hypothetical protein
VAAPCLAAGAAAEPREAPSPLPRASEDVLPQQLAAARSLVASLEERPPTDRLDDPPPIDEFEAIRWFPLPAEALARLHDRDRHAA